MTEPDKEVLEFIKHFYGKDPDFAKNLFSYGQCFWFAHILKTRFAPFYPNTAIYYHPIENHFACCINGNLYDITGNLSNPSSGWQPWDEYIHFDHENTRHIFRDCILQIPLEDYPPTFKYRYPWYYVS